MQLNRNTCRKFHNRVNAESDMRIKLSLIKSNILYICNSIKPFHQSLKFKRPNKLLFKHLMINSENIF